MLKCVLCSLRLRSWGIFVLGGLIITRNDLSILYGEILIRVIVKL